MTVTDVEAPVVRVFGIRHHGPGSARSVVAALDELEPDAVLVEGPADADPLLALASQPGMSPPVALLAYAADDSRTAAFWPFAVFSPEWQAISWAGRHGVPVHFCDLPTSAVLAARDEQQHEEPPDPVRRDPLARLAVAAGYDDPERWWDDVIESRGDGGAPFDAITDAMSELRTATPAQPNQAHEDRREAHMRTVLRQTLKEGARRVAVICGAWHAPALTGRLPTAAADAALLRGMAKRKTSLTWVPWTHSRLSVASGYGAGVASPGWYHHLFTEPDRPVTRWLTSVAGVLRTEDLPVSTAHVIEAVRLAEMLATLRGRPLAGLGEVNEATRAVLCEGDDVMLGLVVRRLVVGEAMGSVPEDAPTVPLEADLRAQARALRLKMEPATRTLDLDLRKPTDGERSRLLHRLRLLGVGWGTPARSDVRNTGTFRESWSLLWSPELALDLIEASMWGTTVESACAARLLDGAQTAALPALTLAVEGCLLADLPDVLPGLLSALDAASARDRDILHLMSALPALVRSLKYGDVRGTDTASLGEVADALLVRICAGLPAAVTGLDDDAATELRGYIDGVHAAVNLRAQPESRSRWLATLVVLSRREDVHGLVTGRIVRLLNDAGALPDGGAAIRLARTLSVGTPAATKAAWVEGFLAGGGMLLVRDTALLNLLDEWVCRLGEQAFMDTLPLLRRTFGSFASGERRSVGEQVRRGTGARTVVDDAVDPVRAEAAVRAVAALLGLPR